MIQRRSRLSITLLWIISIIYVGAVFRPEDLGRDYRKMIENAVKDFSPNTRDNVIQLLYSWEGKTSGKKLADTGARYG